VFITDDGYLISDYHVVKGAAKVRLLTGAGLIDATVVTANATSGTRMVDSITFGDVASEKSHAFSSANFEREQ
jgi:hypothetical protein